MSFFTRFSHSTAIKTYTKQVTYNSVVISVMSIVRPGKRHRVASLVANLDHIFIRLMPGIRSESSLQHLLLHVQSTT